MIGHRATSTPPIGSNQHIRPELYTKAPANPIAHHLRNIATHQRPGTHDSILTLYSAPTRDIIHLPASQKIQQSCSPLIKSHPGRTKPDD